MTFFAYIHVKPDTVDANGVFYVGKGKGARHLNFTDRNGYHLNTIKKYGKNNILVGRLDCSSEMTAYMLEVGLIACLRRMGSPLTNLTDGGEGRSGFVTSEEVKAKLRANASAKRPEVRAKMSASRMGHAVTAETRERIALTKRGKPRSEETKRKVADALRGRKQPPRSAETCAKLSAALKKLPGRRKSPEECAKIKATLSAYWASKRQVAI